jgi:ubiquinone/menaquinone biosynthesis C-methylase UbiE
VLDVGAGVGDNARALAQRGSNVVAISPDQAHARYFRSRPDNHIRYIQTTFERLVIDQQFDLVFISEALNYFDRRAGLEQVRRFLRPRGHLLVASIFTRPPPNVYPHDFDIANEEYVGLARQYGLDLIQSRDVTENVSATISYAGRMLRRYVFPAFRWASALDRARNILTYYERRTDVHYFRTHYRYAFLLFRAST